MTSPLVRFGAGLGSVVAIKPPFHHHHHIVIINKQSASIQFHDASHITHPRFNTLNYPYKPILHPPSRRLSPSHRPRKEKPRSVEEVLLKVDAGAKKTKETYSRRGETGEGRCRLPVHLCTRTPDRKMWRRNRDKKEKEAADIARQNGKPEARWRGYVANKNRKRRPNIAENLDWSRGSLEVLTIRGIRRWS